jgi:hypothetical protein
MKIKKESRGRPCRIISTEITEKGKRKQITFYRNKKNPKEYGNEIYSGRNYLVGLGADEFSSYSRNYPHGKGLPKKYKQIASKLKKVS